MPVIQVPWFCCFYTTFSLIGHAFCVEKMTATIFFCGWQDCNNLIPNRPRLLDKLFRGKSPLPCYSMGIMLLFSTLVFQNPFFANQITFHHFMRISEMKAWWSFFPLSSNWTGLSSVMIKWAFGMTIFPTKWPANEQLGDSHQPVFFAEMKKMETIFLAAYKFDRFYPWIWGYHPSMQLSRE